MTNSVFNRFLTGTNQGLFDLSFLLLRLAIGIFLFAAGSGKVLGWFAGYGLEKSLAGYHQMGISTPLAYLSIYTEFLGSLLILVGLFTRFAAFAVVINMVVATAVTVPHGIFGPMGAQTAIVFLIISLIILLGGPMAYSLDYLLFSRDRTD